MIRWWKTRRKLNEELHLANLHVRSLARLRDYLLVRLFEADDRIVDLEARAQVLTGINTDDPLLDATDFAHPAWWRGHDQSAAMAASIVTRWLDGEDSGAGCMREPWESLRRRVYALVAFTNNYPVPMILTCPSCSMQHLDDDGSMCFIGPTHRCSGCGREWKPANVPTIGVETLNSEVEKPEPLTDEDRRRGRA